VRAFPPMVVVSLVVPYPPGRTDPDFAVLIASVGMVGIVLDITLKVRGT
jgi:hypothetical protein